jgi:hypothetical protein
MDAHDVHHLPVVEGEHAVGMVGWRDVLRSSSAGALPKPISLPSR